MTLDEGVMGRVEYRGQDRGIKNFVGLENVPFEV
jgi:hypothetical protein